MRTVVYIALAVVVIVALLAAGLALAPRYGIRAVIGPAVRPLTDRHFQPTPERVARGKYLVEGVGHCFGCHSPFDPNSKTGEPPQGQAGSGDSFQVAPNFIIVLPNLTPDPDTGIGNISDDALARAIREGINHQGQAMAPIMAYRQYRYMSDEDLASIIVYLRSLPPIRRELPKRRLPWKNQAHYNHYPQPISAAVPAPDFHNKVALGAYYVKLGKCEDCHTPLDDDNRPLPGLAFAGGNFIEEANKAALNLTNDPSGISYYDEAMFIRVMRTGKVGARELSSAMPWWYIGHMSDEDLGAIFAYLRSLPPVHHRVDNSLPPTWCRLCRRKHGAGEQN